MAHATQLFVAITGVVIGLSHLLRPNDWASAYTSIHRAGRPGAFINGAIHLFPGAIIVAGQWLWTWPEVVLTVFGCLLIAKGAVCFLLPDLALRSIGIGKSAQGFRFAGAMCLLLSGWAIYCLLAHH